MQPITVEASARRTAGRLPQQQDRSCRRQQGKNGESDLKTSDKTDGKNDAEAGKDAASEDADKNTEKNVKTTDVTEDTTLMFTGDVLFANSFKTNYDAGGIDAVIDNGMKELLVNADITMVNEEFPFSNRGTQMEDKQYTFRTDPSYAACIKGNGRGRGHSGK